VRRLPAARWDGTEWLATDVNLAALTDLSGTWIDRVHGRQPPDSIILDMDSSESLTHGEQEDSAWNGYFGCTCYDPLFLFNQFGDLERCLLRPGHVRGAEDWRLVLAPVIVRYRDRGIVLLLAPMRRSASQPGIAAADGAPADPAGRPPAEEDRS
jgi:Transposase DDE domain group 1